MWSNGPVRALVQRVVSASVTDRGRDEVVGSIGAGLLVFVGATHGDGAAEAAKLAEKVWHLRVFPDRHGAMNRSLADRSAAAEPAGVLVVSQFTLYADVRKGRRPSFVAAARPELAEPLVDAVVEQLRVLGAEPQAGRFRADMAVELVNDGPVTLMLEV